MAEIEERLAVLETKVALKELVAIAAMGRGALWLALKIGAAALGIVAVGKFTLDLASSYVGKH